jgi:hypothetical protein
MNDSPTTDCSITAIAESAGSRAPAARAAAPKQAFTSGGFTAEVRKSPRATSTTPAGTWKFSSNVTEFIAAPQMASAA